MSSLHFIRPLWFLALLPWGILLWHFLSQKPILKAWSAICDAHLLTHLVRTQGQSKRFFSVILLFLSLFFMIVSLSGPSWSLLPVPIYQKIEPHVVVLDMSQEMFLKDLSPNRLLRAKFILHDLFHEQDKGQFAMIAHTREPFVVSPLTDDGETIDALLSSLTSDVMPIQGYRLDNALLEAQQLIKQAGFSKGSILVLTAHLPIKADMQVAKKLARAGMAISIIPMTTESSPLYYQFAHAGHGQVIDVAQSRLGLKKWLNRSNADHLLDKKRDASVMKDEGRWFLIPALLCLLPVFRRGWLQRVNA